MPPTFLPMPEPTRARTRPCLLDSPGLPSKMCQIASVWQLSGNMILSAIVCNSTTADITLPKGHVQARALHVHGARGGPPRPPILADRTRGRSNAASTLAELPPLGVSNQARRVCGGSAPPELLGRANPSSVDSPPSVGPNPTRWSDPTQRAPHCPSPLRLDSIESLRRACPGPVETIAMAIASRRKTGDRQRDWDEDAHPTRKLVEAAQRSPKPLETWPNTCHPANGRASLHCNGLCH